MILQSISRDAQTVEIVHPDGRKHTLFFHGTSQQPVPEGFGFSPYGLKAYSPWLRVVNKDRSLGKLDQSMLVETAPAPSSDPAAKDAPAAEKSKQQVSVAAEKTK